MLGILEKGGNVIAIPVTDVKAKTLLPIMVSTVEQGSEIHSDELHSYRSLIRLKYDHKYVRHSEGEYVTNGVHVNGIGNFWSQLKRGIIGVYHHTSPKHLGRYCDEFAYRYNTREVKDVARFNNILSNVEGRLTWNRLTEKSQ